MKARDERGVKRKFDTSFSLYAMRLERTEKMKMGKSTQLFLKLLNGTKSARDNTRMGKYMS